MAKFLKDYVLIALAGAAGIASIIFLSCYYNPVPLAVKGNLVCTYNGHRVFVGDLEIRGEAATNGLETFSPHGSYELCGDNSIKCTVTTRTSTSD